MSNESRHHSQGPQGTLIPVNARLSFESAGTGIIVNFPTGGTPSQVISLPAAAAACLELKYLGAAGITAANVPVPLLPLPGITTSPATAFFQQSIVIVGEGEYDDKDDEKDAAAHVQGNSIFHFTLTMSVPGQKIYIMRGSSGRIILYYTDTSMLGISKK